MRPTTRKNIHASASCCIRWVSECSRTWRAGWRSSDVSFTLEVLLKYSAVFPALSIIFHDGQISHHLPHVSGCKSTVEATLAYLHSVMVSGCELMALTLGSITNLTTPPHWSDNNISRRSGRPMIWYSISKLRNRCTQCKGHICKRMGQALALGPSMQHDIDRVNAKCQFSRYNMYSFQHNGSKAVSITHIAHWWWITATSLISPQRGGSIGGIAPNQAFVWDEDGDYRHGLSSTSMLDRGTNC
jgi:hypothetical protein